MVHKNFSVYDSKAQTYSLPFFQAREEMAIRIFTEWVKDPAHPFGKHPEDYTLFSMGEYDDTLGMFTQDKNTAIGNGLQFITEEQK